jgi:uncharacterized protein (TIGR02246 family)
MRMKLILLAALTLLPWTAAYAETVDDVAIREIEARQQAAWNAHDARAYAALFSEDADVINVLGWWWRSRAELEQKLGSAFAFVFSRSVLQIEDVSIRLLSPRLAVAHVVWTMTGALSPDGSGSNVPQRGIQIQVLRKTTGNWRIISFQNTNSIPERSFPTAPAGAR